MVVVGSTSTLVLEMDVTIDPKPPTMGLTHWAQLVGVKASLPLRAHAIGCAFIGPHHTILYSE